MPEQGSMDNALVQKMEHMLVKVEAMQKTLESKDAELATLKKKREDREYIKKKAAVQDTLPVIKLKEDLNSKVHEIKIWEQRVNEREQAIRALGMASMGELQDQVERLNERDEKEEDMIHKHRIENTEIELEIKRTEKQIRAREAILKKAKTTLAGAQRRHEHVTERTRENHESVGDMKATLSDMDSLAYRKEQNIQHLEDLNAVLVDVDGALELLGKAVETAKLNEHLVDAKGRREVEKTFESSPPMQLWMGISRCSVVTLKARDVGIRMNKRWISEDQVRQAQKNIVKRNGETFAIAQMLAARETALNDELKRLELEHADKSSDVVNNEIEKQQLESFFLRHQEEVGALEESIPVWEGKRKEEEEKMVELTQSWERHRGATQQKYERALAAMTAQQQLVGREMEEIKKLRHQCKADKTQELQSKHQQYLRAADELLAVDGDDIDDLMLEGEVTL